MELTSLEELDFNEAGEWPVIIKVIAIILLCIVIWAGGYYFIIKDKQSGLRDVEAKEIKLKQEFATKQRKVANLDAYRSQLVEMEAMLGTMLEQLTNESEVAALLIDISRTGLVNGLVFELFKPGDENQRDFYAELPVTMTVTGTYHQFGRFVSGLAALPRIVTVHDFMIKPLGKDSDKMTMDISVKTYRYFSDNEESVD